MKKLWFLLSVCAVLSIGIYVFHSISKEEPHLQSTKHLKNSYGPYFFPIAIAKFSSANLPSLIIKLNGNDVLAELDLGFRGEAVLPKEVLERIEDKQFIDEKTMYGPRGASYKKKRYKAPKIEIGKVTFSDCIIQEEIDEFAFISTIQLGTKTESIYAPGRIGWELFKNCNLFLDLPNAKAAFCDSIKTLQNRGYPSEQFVKTKLLSERGFIEMKAMGPDGEQIWTLDTGCTWNILNCSAQGKSIEEMSLDSKNIDEFSISINDTAFNQISFHKLPIELPIPVYGILGMEFFKKHQVFIDFSENQIYIRKVPPSK
ncbi:MAG: hypothetical protein K1X28_05355 [Parachlamydiales bacterium]|nr:hypothetical protein [Parachlamydiales bacterium]